MKTLFDPESILNVQNQITLLTGYQLMNNKQLDHVEMAWTGLLTFVFDDNSYININML